MKLYQLTRLIIHLMCIDLNLGEPWQSDFIGTGVFFRQSASELVFNSGWNRPINNVVLHNGTNTFYFVFYFRFSPYFTRIHFCIYHSENCVGELYCQFSYKWRSKQTNKQVNEKRPLKHRWNCLCFDTFTIQWIQWIKLSCDFHLERNVRIPIWV